LKLRLANSRSVSEEKEEKLKETRRENHGERSAVLMPIMAV
jgi:hypothetical protein